MAYEVKENNAALVGKGAQFFASGSLAKLQAIAAVVIATRDEQIDALAINAAQRPKGKDIQEGIREAFGGLNKEKARDEYDVCSLSFRVLNKLSKEREADLSAAVKHRDPAKLADVLATLAGRATVAAVKAWMTGDKAKAEPKKPGEQALAYIQKKEDELTDDDLAKLAEAVSGLIAKRKRLAQEIAEAEAEAEAA